MDIDFKIPYVIGMTLPDEMTELDRHYLTTFANGEPPFDYMPLTENHRIDRVDIAPSDLMYYRDEEGATPGILVWVSHFVKYGRPMYDTRHLQVMTVHHLYSEHGWTLDDHDPYDGIVGEIKYREVHLPHTGIWRTAENDPVKGLVDREHITDLLIDWTM